MIQKNRHHPYVVLNTHFLDDPRLTWAAKGVLAYVLSQPDEETIRLVQLVNCSPDGRGAIEAALEELHTCGYVALNRAQEPVARDANPGEEGLS